MVLVGEIVLSYIVMVIGIYYVEIIDENGCVFVFNFISLSNDCGDVIGMGGGLFCNNLGYIFMVMDNGVCDNCVYIVEVIGSLFGLILWFFDDFDSGVNNLVSGENVIYQFIKFGFYCIFMLVIYDNVGSNVVCVEMILDIILVVVDFDYDGVCLGVFV